MFSVGINRNPRSTNEIANDANRMVYDWWRAVRDHPAELGARMMSTPVHEAQYAECYAMIYGPGADPERLPLIDRAWCATVLMMDGLMHALSANKATTWAPRWRSAALTREGIRDRIETLAAHIRRVQFCCRDAIDVLKRSAPCADALIYADPPYLSAETRTYPGADALDAGNLADVLMAQAGDVAVSGYAGDALIRTLQDAGWHRHECSVPFSQIAGSRTEERLEVLMTSYATAAPSDFTLQGDAL